MTNIPTQWQLADTKRITNSTPRVRRSVVHQDITSKRQFDVSKAN